MNKSLVTGPSQQQYLGDLSENSPLPFSIPLSIDSDLPSGDYPVSLNVTYSDNLRMVHELLLNDTVVYEGQPSTSSNNDSNNDCVHFCEWIFGYLSNGDHCHHCDYSWVVFDQAETQEEERRKN